MPATRVAGADGSTSACHCYWFFPFILLFPAAASTRLRPSPPPASPASAASPTSRHLLPGLPGLPGLRRLPDLPPPL
ncbi:hypothetical protein GUJ93_ZPchr0011g28885 [Zizania palustris]|uniref:Uncharacterized protein n=1 Tax=Zizania palustris TaxID=103762 RepID=A0A8J5WG96_ZIZPA|nr:hypothetical protein GUJ93_ZPchr0011g28885 [Zizania palustris]